MFYGKYLLWMILIFLSERSGEGGWKLTYVSEDASFGLQTIYSPIFKGITLWNFPFLGYGGYFCFFSLGSYIKRPRSSLRLKFVKSLFTYLVGKEKNVEYLVNEQKWHTAWWLETVPSSHLEEITISSYSPPNVIYDDLPSESAFVLYLSQSTASSKLAVLFWC